MGFSLMGAGQWAKKAQQVTLPTGGLYPIPAGQYIVNTGPYTFIQWFDAASGIWRNFTTPAFGGTSQLVTSDGTNIRLANLTGTLAGAIVTTGGSGYTNGIYPAGTGTGIASSPTATVAAGGGTNVGTLNVIVGGVINTTVTITTAGSGYTRPPTLVFSQPPTGGIPASGVCAITAGAITSVTVTNAGAGYTTAPTISLVRDPQDTTGVNGVLTVNATLAQSGAISALTVADPGRGMTSVPAITFSPASTTAATAIMCFTATAVTWTGPNHANTTGNWGLINSSVVAGSGTTTNPAITTGLFVPRMGTTAVSTSGSPTTTVINDGGIHQVVPAAVLVNNSDGTINANMSAVTIASGGLTDTSYLLPL